jgi:menaquinone-dependent protoporphyrinogen oxidase
MVVASKHGSTIALAGAIGQQMSAQGASVIVAGPDDDVDLDGVDAVVLGSAVYLGRWMRSARRFVKRRGPELQRCAVWLFSSGPVDDEPGPGLDPAQLEQLMTQTGAVEHREFGGCLDRESLGPIETLIASGAGVSDADHRDWTEVRVWAQTILDATVRSVEGTVS